jgi:hypothetical protein
MQYLSCGFLGVLLSVCVPARAFDRDEWKLVFEDSFERAQVGPGWIIQGKAEIVNGRLRYGLDDNHLALIDRHFAADVRIEFDAEAAPDKPPCDLSAALACGRNAGNYGNGYLLAFGGNFNTMHQIQGGRDMQSVRTWYPPERIVPGKAHHICAMKEGKTLTLEVDGKVLLTTTDKDPLGGPGFDMVGTVTWNGMFVDNVRVYERKTPHPDTPRYVAALKGLPFTLSEDRKLSAAKGAGDAAIRRGVELYNAGKPREAEAEFLSFPDPETRAAGVAYAVGHLYYDAGVEDFKRAGQMLIDLAAAHSNDERLQDYAELGRRAQALSVLRFEGLPNGELAADAIISMGAANNPFYDKAYFYKARLLRAHSMEGANRGMNVPMAMFAELKERYPENPSLRELLGEPIPWGEDLIDDTSSAPAWARYLRELYARQCAVLNWWFTKRQYKSGELGGGWGDDCEILRDWGPLASISTGDPAIVAGIERLCQGIWGTAINPKWGFSGYGDAEHCSEPSADTQPTMMILRWGDPLWIERNMRSARTIRDIYMGVDRTGHYRFRSGFYGDDVVGKNPQQEGDVHYNTRTMKHLQHLAFWGNVEARRVYLSWLDGWREQTMMDYPKKPAGVVPGQLFFPSGTVIPPAGTKPEDWTSSNAPNPDSALGMGGMIQGGFMAAYWLTRDRKFLEPMYEYCMRTAYGPLLKPNGLKPGSPDWMLCGQQGDTHTDTMAMFRWLSGDRTMEEYLLRFATPYQRYMVTNDLDAFMKAVERAAKSMRTNFRLMTEELLQTDRAGLPCTRETLGAYTGALHTWRDGLLPTMAVTWEVPDPNFAALVVASTPDRLRVWVYSFHDEPIRMGMRIWRLTPGTYVASHGEIMKGESTNLRYGWRPEEAFTYRRRLDTYHVEVPPRKAYCVDLRLLRPIEVPETAPDLAIADRDVVSAGPGMIQATVHSVGSGSASNVLVALEAGDGSGQWKRVAERRTGDLPTPGLDPVTETLTFSDVKPAKAYRVVLDPDQRVDELYEGNNIGTLVVPAK